MDRGFPTGPRLTSSHSLSRIKYAASFLPLVPFNHSLLHNLFSVQVHFLFFSLCSFLVHGHHATLKMLYICSRLLLVYSLLKCSGILATLDISRFPPLLLFHFLNISLSLSLSLSFSLFLLLSHSAIVIFRQSITTIHTFFPDIHRNTEIRLKT